MTEKLIKIEVFSTFERLGGLMLGLLRGIMLSSLLLITLLFTHIPYFEKSIKDRSYTGNTVLIVVPFIYDKVSLVVPVLRLGAKNEALSRMTGYGEQIGFLKGPREDTDKKATLKGD